MQQKCPAAICTWNNSNLGPDYVQFLGTCHVSRGARNAAMAAANQMSPQSELRSIFLVSQKDMDPLVVPPSTVYVAMCTLTTSLLSAIGCSSLVSSLNPTPIEGSLHTLAKGAALESGHLLLKTLGLPKGVAKVTLCRLPINSI